MKNIFSILALIVCFSGFSQKVKLKKGEILIDEVLWAKYTDCGPFDSNCSILNLSGEEVIFMKLHNIPGGAPRTQSNPQGNFSYKEVKFLGLNATVEFEGTTDKKIFALIYNAKLIGEDGQLDEEKVSRFIEKYGTPVSSRNTSTNTTNTIIIKEEPRRSGVNINLGR